MQQRNAFASTRTPYTTRGILRGTQQQPPITGHWVLRPATPPDSCLVSEQFGDRLQGRGFVAVA